jgi:hypothetical protein
MALEKRTTSEYVIQCDTCGIRAADGADDERLAESHAKAEGFVTSSRWNGQAHVVRWICTYCQEDEQMEAENSR